VKKQAILRLSSSRITWPDVATQGWPDWRSGRSWGRGYRLVRCRRNHTIYSQLNYTKPASTKCLMLRRKLRLNYMIHLIQLAAWNAFATWIQSPRELHPWSSLLQTSPDRRKPTASTTLRNVSSERMNHSFPFRSLGYTGREHNWWMSHPSSAFTSVVALHPLFGLRSGMYQVTVLWETQSSQWPVGSTFPSKNSIKLVLVKIKKCSTIAAVWRSAERFEHKNRIKSLTMNENR
jgi:hypothetical protein